MLRITEIYSIQSEKYEHRMSADSFVAIYKRVIFYKSETEPSSFFKESWIQVSSGICLERRIYGRV